MEYLREALDKMSANWSDLMQSQTLLVAWATLIGLALMLALVVYAMVSIARVFLLYVVCQYCCTDTQLATRYGRWAVVSGATDGIGKALAKELAARGLSILVIGRNEEKLADTRRMLQQVPNVGQVETVKIDLADSSPENFARIRHQIDPDHRDIGILINNAGVFTNRYARFNKFPMDEIAAMVNLNILATLHLTRMIMPGMVERGRGLLLNVSSGFGRAPAPYTCVYGATKTFVSHFSKQLQAEYKQHPIDIVLLEPGPVRTNMLRAASKSPDSFFSPTAEQFARTTVSALAAGRRQIAGNPIHEFMNSSLGLAQLVGLGSFAIGLFVSRTGGDLHLSPVAKRRQPIEADRTQKKPSEAQIPK